MKGHGMDDLTAAKQKHPQARICLSCLGHENQFCQVPLFSSRVVDLFPALPSTTRWGGYFGLEGERRRERARWTEGRRALLLPSNSLLACAVFSTGVGRLGCKIINSIRLDPPPSTLECQDNKRSFMYGCVRSWNPTIPIHPSKLYYWTCIPALYLSYVLLHLILAAPWPLGRGTFAE